MFDKIVFYAEAVMWIVIILSIIIGVIVFVFSRKKRFGLETEQFEKWASFQRLDSKTYVPAEDIIDDMLVFENGTRFVMAIACRGNNFYDLSLDEQLAVSDGYLGFVNTINKPLTKRVVSRPMNLEDMIKNHTDSMNAKVKLLKELYENVSALYKERENEPDEERKKIYDDEIKRVEELIRVNEWKQQHLSHELLYLSMFDGESADPIPEDYYLVGWTFNPMDFPVEITKEEIRQRARIELEAIARQKMGALSQAKVPSRLVTGVELEELVRQHFRPITADVFRSSDLEKTNIDGCIADADKSLGELKKRLESERPQTKEG